MGQCHCAACQRVGGGGPHYFELVDAKAFVWTDGTPRSYMRPDLENAVTRFFCGQCGTQIVTQRQDQSDLVLKVGSLDDVSHFSPRVALCHAQAQPFHSVPDGVRVFEAFPPQR
ncbi:GFA family protein [Tateyamaria armeniaca]|uniref:GFA family protein n=1 Tax=Tateyamaria armeniaca TaxID=2518930 RepID=A0ABW8UWX8_9RHOB